MKFASNKVNIYSVKMTIMMEDILYMYVHPKGWCIRNSFKVTCFTPAATSLLLWKLVQLILQYRVTLSTKSPGDWETLHLSLTFKHPQNTGIVIMLDFWTDRICHSGCWQTPDSGDNILAAQNISQVVHKIIITSPNSQRNTHYHTFHTSSHFLIWWKCHITCSSRTSRKFKFLFQ